VHRSAAAGERHVAVGKTPVSTNLAGTRLGDFEVLRELGRGGMGVVYEARQVSLNRKVALKVLAGSLGLTDKAVQRFRREAEAAAKLHHTNIVAVYVIGEHDGTLFYAMELVEGPSLDQVIRQLRAGGGDSPSSASLGNTNDPSSDLSRTAPYVEGATNAGATAGLNSPLADRGGGYFDAVARMVAEVADALEYAHREGVIHRDVKPSNLLLSPPGRLSLNDFGLARVLEQPGMTTTGEFLGTPAYMSPEQIRAGRVPVDHRTDVYSLGATLYEVLTLRPPFRGERRDQVLAQILQAEPEAPRRLNAKVPVDLETICLKALEKDPGRRYQSAGALAEDLRRYVNRFAIGARRAGPVRRLAKWIRRRPSVAAAAACLFLAALAIVAFAYRAYRAERLRLTEQAAAEERLRDEQERARLRLLDEKIGHAYLTATTGDLRRTDEAIKEIETLGASTGQVRLLRGVVAYFRQDAEGAVGELEQAIKLLPDSVAARALLAMTYVDRGQLAAAGPGLYVEMERLSPASPEDYLFRGFARSMTEHGQGLADMDEALRRRDSPLGRALRAVVRAERAIDSGNCRYADEALADSDVARGLLPDNQMALCASLFARLAAAAVYQEAGLRDRRMAVLQDAARIVQTLDPFLGRANPTWLTWQYYDDLGDTDKALEVARRALDRSSGPIPRFYCAVSLYRQGRFAEGLKCLPEGAQADLLGDITRGFLLAELPGGPHVALEEYNRFARKYPTAIEEHVEPGYLLLLLGQKAEARRILRSYRPPIARSSQWKGFYEALERFARGELSEEAYLAAAGASRWQQCQAHTYIGLARLADGDREAARKHFSGAVGTHAFEIFEWNWSEMFLSRLESDPTWPSWIPQKK
jgi:serine/threonine protein kinase